MPRKKRTRPKRLEETYATYAVAIERWDWALSFGTNAGNRFNGDPYADYRHLRIAGSVLEPKNIKAESASLTVFPDTCLNEDKRQENVRHSVASVHVQDNVLHGYVSMPADALPSVLQLLNAGRPVYLVMHGERLRYRKALIRSYRIDTEWEEETEEQTNGNACPS